MLVRSRAREELIEEFHTQMEELQDECPTREEAEENTAVDQVPFEYPLQACLGTQSCKPNANLLIDLQNIEF